MALSIANEKDGQHCKVCGTFTYRGTGFCSDTCFWNWQKKKAICEFCGQEFYKTHKNKKYCFDKCRLQAMYARGRAKRALKERVCPECGIVFMPNHGKQIYHSIKCIQRAWYKRRKQSDLTAQREALLNALKGVLEAKQVALQAKSKKAVKAPVKRQTANKESTARKVYKLMQKYKHECIGCGIKFYSVQNSVYCSPRCENMDF